jgi:drug/metabolite transporter (DMT)-like permease
VIKIGLRDLPPIRFAAIRLVIALAVLAPLLLARREILRQTVQHWRLIATSGLLLLGVNYTLVFWGAQHVSSGFTAVLQATTPAFGVWLSHAIAREPVQRAHVLGTIVGAAGLPIIFSEQLHIAGAKVFLGATPMLAISIVEPLFAVLPGALIFHEALSWRVALGGACVLASAWIILRSHT